MRPGVGEDEPSAGVRALGHIALFMGLAYPFGDDDPTGGGVGEIVLPVGEPLVLLFFAFAFIALRYLRRRKTAKV